MAQLEGADRAFAFTSGMAALDVVCKLVGVAPPMGLADGLALRASEQASHCG